MLHHHRLTMREVPVRMFQRGGGVSSITGSGKSVLLHGQGAARALRRPRPRARRSPSRARPRRSPRTTGSDGHRLQIVAIVGAVGLLLFVLELVRRRALMERYALLWLLAARRHPRAGDLGRRARAMIARQLGILSAPNALFFVAIAFILLLLLHFSAAMSRLTDQSKVLAQRQAILEQRLERGRARSRYRERRARAAAAQPLKRADLPFESLGQRRPRVAVEVDAVRVDRRRRPACGPPRRSPAGRRPARDAAVGRADDPRRLAVVAEHEHRAARGEVLEQLVGGHAAVADAPWANTSRLSAPRCSASACGRSSIPTERAMPPSRSSASSARSSVVVGPANTISSRSARSGQRRRNSTMPSRNVRGERPATPARPVCTSEWRVRRRAGRRRRARCSPPGRTRW